MSLFFVYFFFFFFPSTLLLTLFFHFPPLLSVICAFVARLYDCALLSLSHCTFSATISSNLPFCKPFFLFFLFAYPLYCPADTSLIRKHFLSLPYYFSCSFLRCKSDSDTVSACHSQSPRDTCIVRLLFYSFHLICSPPPMT